MQLTGKEAAVAESRADLCCEIRTARVLEVCTGSAQPFCNTRDHRNELRWWKQTLARKCSRFSIDPVGTSELSSGHTDHSAVWHNSLARRRRFHPFDALGSILPRKECPTLDSTDRQGTGSGAHVCACSHFTNNSYHPCSVSVHFAFCCDVLQSPSKQHS